MLNVLCDSVKTGTSASMDNDVTHLVQCACCIPIRQDLLSGITLRAICGGILAIRGDTHVNLEEKEHLNNDERSQNKPRVHVRSSATLDSLRWNRWCSQNL